MKKRSAWSISVGVLGVALIVAMCGCRQPPEAEAPPAGSARTERPAAEQVQMPAEGKAPKGPEVDVAVAFAQELHAQKYDAAYRRLSPRSRQDLSSQEWQEGLSQAPAFLEEGVPPLMLIYAKEHEVGEVSVKGDYATAAVTLRGSRPIPVHLIREKGKWWVDWTDEGQVRNLLDQTLSVFGGEVGHLGMTALFAGGGAGATVFLASPVFAQCGAVSSEQEGDRAVVEVAGTASVEAIVPVRKSAGRWEVDWQSVSVGEQARAGSEEGGAPGAALERARERAQQASCLSNLKQLALATLMYAQDYDQVLPQADNWCDAIWEYMRNEELFRCPSDPEHEYGYALNRNLSGRHLAEISRPAETVLIFDSTAGKKNAADTGQSWPSKGRHSGGNNCTWADGHAKWLKEKPDFSL
jgi:prepilin-type processing-associated H-X9-DG protein